MQEMCETFVLIFVRDFSILLNVLTAYSAQKEPILGKLSRAVGALQRERAEDFAIFRCYLAYLQRFTFSIAEQIAKIPNKRSKISEIFRYLCLLQHALYQHVTNKFL